MNMGLSVDSSSYTWNNATTGGGGGFVPAIIFNQTEKNLLYARTDMGGAYRLNSASNSWIPLTDWVGFEDWNLLGCESLASDPVEPNRIYIAAGTYTNNWAGNGAILRSTDRGDTWQKTDLSFKIGGNMPGRSMGERLAIDPNNNKILYLGTHNGNGLWKSTDYGVTWSKVASFTATGTYKDPNFNDTTGVVWVTFDSSTGTSGNATQTIYAGVADTTQSIYKSTDGGATWQAIAGQPTGFLPHHGVLSSKGFLYITYSNGCGPYDGTKGDVWKYDTKTGNWTNISPVPSSSTDNYFGYGGLAVDAQQPNILMVTSLNAWWPDALIYRSTDGGSTWSPIWSWGSYPERTLRYTQDISAAPWLDWGTTKSLPEITPKLGWMIGGIAIDPFNSDRMMYGTGATVYGSDNLTNWDNGGTIKIEVKAQGIEETAINALISPPSGANLISGMGDICGFRHDDLTKAPAKMMTTPTFTTTTSIDYAELTPTFIVRVGNADTSSSVKSSGFSYDGGKNWFAGGTDISGLTGGGTIAAAADASIVVWSPAGSSAPVSYSKDNGNSWTACSGIPSQATVAADRVNPKKFYGFANGKFYISTDGGATFTVTTATGLPTTGTGNFKAIPGQEGDIWLTGGSSAEGVYGIWHSTDAGASFTKLTNVQEADTVGFGKAASGQSYMALYTSAKIDNIRGIFRSDDQGATWVRINDDQHQYGCTNTDITGDPRIYGRVYVATNGRGVVYGDIQSVSIVSVQVTAPTEGQSFEYPSQASPITISATASTMSGTISKVQYFANGTKIGESTTSPYSITWYPGAYAQSSTGIDSYAITASATDSNGTSTTSAAVNIKVKLLLAPTENLKIEAFNGTTAATTNSISPKLKITNSSQTTVSLDTVKIRYYYTIDGDKQQSFWCDNAAITSPSYQGITSSVTGTFVKMSTAKTGADYYMEIGFTTAAGSLTSGQVLELQLRFAKTDWSNYTQTDDYSFNASASTYADTSTIPLYISSQLSIGTEP